MGTRHHANAVQTTTKSWMMALVEPKALTVTTTALFAVPRACVSNVSTPITVTMTGPAKPAWTTGSCNSGSSCTECETGYGWVDETSTCDAYSDALEYCETQIETGLSRKVPFVSAWGGNALKRQKTPRWESRCVVELSYELVENRINTSGTART